MTQGSITLEQLDRALLAQREWAEPGESLSINQVLQRLGYVNTQERARQPTPATRPHRTQSSVEFAFGVHVALPKRLIGGRHIPLITFKVQVWVCLRTMRLQRL